MAFRIRTTKYNNRKTECGGLVFDSDNEAQVWQELKLLEAAKEIRDLKRQVPIPLFALNGAHVADYKADFTYRENGKLVIHEVKGFATEVYKLKKKMFLDNYPDLNLVFREVKVGKQRR